MKISIITATYNSEKNISECLQSVAGQAHNNIEHIVVDGGSTDNTMEIVKSFPSVTKYISEPDKGIYDALNKGIKMAGGDVIGFLHSDDVLGSTIIIKKITELFSQKNIQGVYGNLVFVNSENPDKVVRTWKSKPFDRINIKYGWMPPHPTLYLRKEVYQKHGPFDISFKIAGDYNFMVGVMKDKEIYLEYLPEIITRMRMGGASTGSINDLITKSKEDIRALKNNGFKLPLLILIAKNLRKLPQLLKR
jgi:glycosyltransferase